MLNEATLKEWMNKWSLTYIQFRMNPLNEPEFVARSDEWDVTFLIPLRRNHLVNDSISTEELLLIVQDKMREYQNKVLEQRAHDRSSR